MAADSEIMAGGNNLYGGGSVFLLNQRGYSDNHVFLSGSSSPSSTPHSFLGSSSTSMVSFKDVNGSLSNGMFFHQFDPEENMDEDLDEYFHQPEKKRRLTDDQVQFLEKSFELENKLEPDRKTQLAKDLGLQPRQVAIWFQNRRARWKTKQLEKDYEVLQINYINLKVDYENLLKEREKLKAEVLGLTDKLIIQEKLKEKSFEQPEKALVDSSPSENEIFKLASNSGSKQEDISSAKSDLFDSDSPHYTTTTIDGVNDSSFFEADQSDLSQDEEENFNKSSLPIYFLPKIDDVGYSDPCDNIGFLDEDNNAIWSWSY